MELIRTVPADEKSIYDRLEEFKQMRAAVLKYGQTAFSFDVHEVPEEYSWFSFTGSRSHGGIAYKKILGTDLIIGDPLLAAEDWQAGISAFLAARPRFTASAAVFGSRTFAQIALDTGGAAVEAQTAVSLNPQTWRPDESAKIRQYTRKSIRAGMTVKQLGREQIENPVLRVRVESLVKDWRENALKRQGNAHNVNLWQDADSKQYFLLADNGEADRFHALLIARPLTRKKGYYLWTARASGCPTGALEALIANSIQYFKQEGVHYLTFGPLQEIRPHTYLNETGGSAVSRYVMNNIVPFVVKQQGYHHSFRFYKKFAFGEGEKIYNLLWPKHAWLRAYCAMSQWLCSKS